MCYDYNIMKSKPISTLKVPLKGYISQSISTSTKKIKGQTVISKLSMPVTYIKGEQNPIKLKKANERLEKAMSKFKK